MEDSKAQLSSGYAMGPPWLFKGSALYQLHLVKAEVARAFIPKDFKLVEAFGYTLGGFFLACYDDSPVGRFDELVVIAGIVWNPPTSCAWAARVLVSKEEACRHGCKEIGLPSHVGIFSKQKSAEVREKSTSMYSSFLNMIGITSSSRKEHTEVKISEVNDSNIMSLCSISIPYLEPKLLGDNKWMGPKIRMSLPSFSGRTIHNPLLLKYACQIECRMRAVMVAKVSGPGANKSDDDDKPCVDRLNNNTLTENKNWNRCISILLSKPVLALEFNFLKMRVNAPTVVASPHQINVAENTSSCFRNS
ncbi:protein NEOXANTHIN-DEFICIENT 1 isoform X2 [Phalaenopsis equestris]|uniref:protein NEOXANTHIN-DEFICIENT 1 isoform X2 n=1 Tax=Phalaenopsis equestris TaxID=78828 RepID=UPI0009E5D009|nr:protein NEOXANTHIN-DEFICIENT 1 isoform X2 [Phalaenopsis equestris]